ncbi:MAG: N-formylglutamate amidohydrolase [Bacteroidota bacterium]
MSTDEIIKNIQKGNCFEANCSDSGFYIRISAYKPWMATAIHDGGGFREELKAKTLKSDLQRWYEEDPCTGQMVCSAPIFLKGLDSRFEYDLNRAPETAVYETAWGEQCWKEPLSIEEKERSLAKHSNYYSVLNALLSKLESEFEKVVLYDMHSYNWKRHDRKVPEFNIGTVLLDQSKWNDEISSWAKHLSAIDIPKNVNDTAINDVFEGKGYQLSQTVEKFKNTLVLATEVSKIYCDELTGEIYEGIVQSLSDQLAKAMEEHAQSYFLKPERVE